MKKQKRYLVTAALPYANGGIHLGHLAGAYLPADIYVRYRRQCGDDVLFICGSDEHGVPITLGARKEGISPQQFVDKYHELMKRSFSDFGIAFDIYSRTTLPLHHQTSREFFLNLYNKNIFIEETTEQYYDEQEHLFLADRYIQGICPRCGYDKAYGDQCERCGSSLTPRDLLQPVSTLSGKPPVLRQTRHWHLPLQRYENWLRQWILHDHAHDWKANVLGQCKSWLDSGLQPRAMTRDLDWGVPVPLPDAEGKVLYVWFDAPIGYISATKELRPDDWQRYWQDQDTQLIHFIGKDNIVFHCIIFPVLLYAHGGYVLPAQVPANEFLNLEGEKLSTSRNWAIWLHDYLADLPDRKDELRYVLTALMPETSDSDFTWKEYQARINNELVAVLGNFVNRVLVLCKKHAGLQVPTPGSLNPLDEKYLNEVQSLPSLVAAHLERFRFRDAQNAMMEVARLGNRYLAETEPWKESDPQRVATVLYTAIQLVACIAVVAEPFLPQTAENIRAMLRWDQRYSLQQIAFPLLRAGHPLAEPRLLFRKFEDEEAERQRNKLFQSQSTLPAQIQEPMNLCTYEDFSKLELRVGTVKAASVVPKADKLLQLTVDLGNERRTIVSGIAQHFSPEQLIGRQVCVVVNLVPRTIRGIESQGMILTAEGADGSLSLLQPAESVPAGAMIR
ncbi:MAG: methionine--tRNA ligase [Chitinophagales bacterium]|nr:methionine--tRNA ligase [Chitinophagales bacterium]MDW8392642.1 methionine--tRNA ligase [Chitinophagales bacterium]